MKPGPCRGLRTFVAVFPPPDCSEAACDEARHILCSEEIRLTPPERLHLTLCFVGPLEEAQRLRVAQQIQERVATFSPFVLGFGAGGSFGGQGGQVYWVSPSHDSLPSLRELRDGVNAAVRSAGVTPAESGRDWTPHLTLGRSRRPSASLTRHRLEQCSFAAGVQWTVEEVRVALSGPGVTAAYPEVSRAPLGP